MTNQQTIQTRQLIGRQMSYEKILLFTAFRQIKRLTKSLTKNDYRTLTQSGRPNVQKLRQHITARFRYAGNLLHSKISVRFKL